MGGAESQDVRAEEEREDPPAKRRVLTKLESMEERLFFFELHIRRYHKLSRQYIRDYDHFFSSSRYEEKREAAAAKEREIRELELEEHLALIEVVVSVGVRTSIISSRAEEEREAAAALRREIMELMEERLVFIEWNLWSHEPGPNLISSSSSTFPFTMSGVEEDEWTEEKSKAAAAKRREIRKLESMEERLAFIQHHLWHHFRHDHHFFSSRDDFWPHHHFFSSRAEEETEEAAKEREIKEKIEAAAAKEREIKEKKLKEEYMAFKRQRLSPREPDPIISRAEKEREDSAKEREIRMLKLIEEYMAFRRLLLRRHHDLSRSEEETEDSCAKRRVIRELESMEESIALIRSKFSPEKIRADSPASSSVSMKSDRSMTPPLNFKGAEEEREAARRREIMESMEESIALIRHHLSSLEPDPNLLSRSKSSPEKKRAGSPASSSESTKSDRSMTPPLNF